MLRQMANCIRVNPKAPYHFNSHNEGRAALQVLIDNHRTSEECLTILGDLVASSAF